MVKYDSTFWVNVLVLLMVLYWVFNVFWEHYKEKRAQIRLDKLRYINQTLDPKVTFYNYIYLDFKDVFIQENITIEW